MYGNEMKMLLKIRSFMVSYWVCLCFSQMQHLAIRFFSSDTILLTLPGLVIQICFHIFTQGNHITRYIYM
jgi:hypothetical protein